MSSQHISSSPELLAPRGLSKTIDDKTLWSGVDLEFRSGTTTAITG
ncbi:hypothetical protein [Corynebacterium propinquum]